MQYYLIVNGMLFNFNPLSMAKAMSFIKAHKLTVFHYSRVQNDVSIDAKTKKGGYGYGVRRAG